MLSCDLHEVPGRHFLMAKTLEHNGMGLLAALI